MEIFNHVPEKLWSKIARQCGHATFFHTFAWAETFKKTYPQFEIATKAFKFAEDDWVIFPMLETGSELNGFFKHYVSNEPGVYGGPIFSGEIDPHKFEKILKHFDSFRTVKLSVHGNPLLDLDPYFGHSKKQSDSTHMLMLTDFKSIDEVYSQYERSVKKGIRNSEMMKIECGAIEDIDGLKQYYKAYEKVQEERGSRATSYYPYELFKNLFEVRNRGVRFWVAKYYNQVIGGAISCEHQRHIALWQAAWLPMAHQMGAGKYVYHRVIEYAMNKGYKYFDFNPSGGHEGTIKLKETFGCARMEFSNYVLEQKNDLWGLYVKLRNTRLLKAFPHRTREDDANAA